MELCIDKDFSTWNNYKLKRKHNLKFPDRKYTFNQFRTFNENIKEYITKEYKKEFDKYISKEDTNEQILYWFNSEIDSFVKIYNENFTTRWYEDELYYGFRKFIRETTLRKNQKTITKVIIDGSTIQLYTNAMFTDENRQKAIDYFLNQKGFSNIVYM